MKLDRQHINTEVIINLPDTFEPLKSISYSAVDCILNNYRKFKELALLKQQSRKRLSKCMLKWKLEFLSWYIQPVSDTASVEKKN